MAKYVIIKVEDDNPKTRSSTGMGIGNFAGTVIDSACDVVNSACDGVFGVATSAVNGVCGLGEAAVCGVENILDSFFSIF